MITTYGAAIILLIVALVFILAYMLVRNKRTATVCLTTSVTLGVCGLVIIAIGFLPIHPQ
jgi:hypothetical protein